MTTTGPTDVELGARNAVLEQIALCAVREIVPNIRRDVTRTREWTADFAFFKQQDIVTGGRSLIGEPRARWSSTDYDEIIHIHRQTFSRYIHTRRTSARKVIVGCVEDE